MRKPAGAKKRLIISHENLPDELKELFKEEYPDGYNGFMQKIVKPNGEPIFVVPLETDDTSYMVKFEVMIDSSVSDEDIDKGLDLPKEDDTVGIEDIDEEKEEGHKSFSLKHGDYDQEDEDDEEDEDDADTHDNEEDDE